MDWVCKFDPWLGTTHAVWIMQMLSLGFSLDCRMTSPMEIIRPCRPVLAKNVQLAGATETPTMSQEKPPWSLCLLCGLGLSATNICISGAREAPKITPTAPPPAVRSCFIHNCLGGRCHVAGMSNSLCCIVLFFASLSMFNFILLPPPPSLLLHHASVIFINKNKVMHLNEDDWHGSGTQVVVDSGKI